MVADPAALAAETSGAGVCAAAAGPEPDVRDLGWGLAVLSRALHERARLAIVDLPGGPRGYLVLSTISSGRLRSQLALANRLGVDRTVMTYLLDDLEAAGLVQRQPDPADRRARHVLLTAKGQAALTRTRCSVRKVEDEVLSALGDDAEVLRELLDRTARDLAGDLSACLAAGDSAHMSCSSEAE